MKLRRDQDQLSWGRMQWTAPSPRRRSANFPMRVQGHQAAGVSLERVGLSVHIAHFMDGSHHVKTALLKSAPSLYPRSY